MIIRGIVCRVYDVSSGKQTKCYKGAQTDDGTLVKVRTPVAHYLKES